MNKIAVLGAGRVGRAIAADLSTRFEVTAVDQDSELLEQLKNNFELLVHQADLNDNNTVKSIAKEHDLVVCAVPGFMGYRTLEAIIDAGRNVVDISFAPENPLQLNQRAVDNGVTAIVDCGVAPGLNNLLAGYHSERMDIESFTCMVGGLPRERIRPYEYKAPFSPIDVLEEYTRPARLVENGEVVIRPALSEAELINFDRIGTLEAFNTDGLRTLLGTLNIPNMKEKTLRYPGHRDLMKIMRDTGFLSSEPIDINGSNIRPIDLASRLLFPHWELKEGEEEFTIMRVQIEGHDNSGHTIKHTYNLYDRYDPESGFSSMARTTGYTATAAVNMLEQGLFDEVGVYPPELIGQRQECYQFILDYMKDRNIKLDKY